MSVFRSLLFDWPRRGLQRGGLALWRGPIRALLRQLVPPLDWRLLIWLAGFALIIFTPRLSWLDALDRQLFQLGTALLPAEPRAQAMDVLELSTTEMQQLLRDPLATGSTTALLYALTNRSHPVALVLPELPRSQASSAERLLQDTPIDAPIHQAWAAREQLRARLSTWLSSPQVFLTLPDLPPYLGEDAQFIDDSSEGTASLPFWQRLSSADVPIHPTLAVAVGAGAFHNWPLRTERGRTDDETGLTQQLFWHHGDNLYPGLALALFRASQTQELANSRFRWQASQRLTRVEDKKNFLLNSDGSVYAAYQRANGLPPLIKHHDTASFLQRDDNHALLVVGVAGDPVLESLVGTVQSLQTGRFFHQPWWASVLQKVLVALLLIYALWLMPKLGNGVRLLAAMLLVLVLVATQTGMQVTQSLWLPLGTATQFLLFATVMVTLWRKQQQPVERLQRQYHDIAVPWSRHLLQQGQLDQAMEALQFCNTSPDVLELLYELGGQHERKRRPAAAVEVYRVLQQRKRRYKDVNKRIKLLEQPQGAAHTALVPSLSKTVVIADSHSQPQFGRYQIESELGRGAMGVVYQGFDPKISRKVAIKTLDYSRYEGDELVAVKSRFFREAEAAGRLRHPNIVSVYDVGEDHDLAYIAMDYIEGQPLSDFTSRKTQLPVSEVLTIIADVADALHYAHGEQIIHRDIKPSNILYHRETHKVTVTDFGIARIIGEHSTQTGEILGSPLYMSPEQILGKKVDRASDIFSLGVTLFQLLAAELPFKGDNIAELSRQILQSKPANIRDLCPGLSASARRIINKALQKEPRDRYRDAAEMAEALRNAS